jgi:hypothetical protein
MMVDRGMLAPRKNCDAMKGKAKDDDNLAIPGGVATMMMARQ